MAKVREITKKDILNITTTNITTTVSDSTPVGYVYTKEEINSIKRIDTLYIRDEYSHDIDNMNLLDNNEYGTDFDSGVCYTLVAKVNNKNVKVFIRFRDDSAYDSVADSSGNDNNLNKTQVRNTLLVSEFNGPPKGIPREYVWLLFATAINIKF